jgi:hypothetical protein
VNHALLAIERLRLDAAMQEHLMLFTASATIKGWTTTD